MRSKYGAKTTVIDGIKFHSLGEGKRYTYLKYRQLAKEISGLQWQVKFPIELNGKHICNYIADFVYLENGITIIEDFKGMRTPVFNLKKKLFEAQYGTELRLSGKCK